MTVDIEVGTMTNEPRRSSRGAAIALMTLLSACVTLPTATQARDFALVVGIDSYLHGDDPAVGVRDLEGAENDARLIAETLRRLGVALPDERVLLGTAATEKAFRRAWDGLLAEASPGDSIIVTFAGHGGREPDERRPTDELDGYDETLMFTDFDPDNPTNGRISDDELFDMFAAADGYQITFVADSCHSGGLTRSGSREFGRTRQWDIWDSPAETIDMPAAVPDVVEKWESLRHVTYLTATADESRVVREIRHESVPHGALSVSFAAGMSGAADADGNGEIVRPELESYVHRRVAMLSDHTQTPGFLPRGAANDSQPLLRLGGASADPVVPNDERAFEISVVGGSAPRVLQGVREVDAATLQFEVRGDETIVYHGIDEITRFEHAGDDDAEAYAWRAVIDRFRLLDALDASYDRAARAVPIALECGGESGCDGRHREGARLTFSVGERQDVARADEHLVMFNIAGNGELQPLYPVPGWDHDTAPALPLRLETRVSEPFGRDDLVAGLCRRDPERLTSFLLARAGGPVPTPASFFEFADEYDCRWGRYPLFTRS